MRIGLGLGLALLCAACSGTSVADDPGDGSGGASGTTSGSGGASTTTGGGGSLGGDTFKITLGPIEVEPGVENTQCIIARLGNEQPVHIGRIHNQLSDLSHHLVLYTSSDTEEVLEPFDCEPFVDTLDPTNGSPLMVSQKAEDTLDLPEGVGFVMEANQMMRLELHYINASATTQSITASSELHELPEEKFEHEAGFLFVGNPDISIPPMSTHTLGPTQFVIPADYADVSFFAVTGHTHQWGTDVQISTTDGSGAPMDAIYAPQDFDWEEPPTIVHDPPFTIPSGGGFSFTCSWNNLSSESVGFGESANDEMCFFWTYYYPSQGSRVCVHTDQFPGGLDMCCPGHAFCDQLL
jgi:hypothetical protein